MRLASVFLIVTALFGAMPASGQQRDFRYRCEAKKKRNAGDASSVITAKSESQAVEAMKKRWPGFSSYSCVLKT